MHDNSAAGIAIKDRTLAFWTDPAIFPSDNDRAFFEIVGSLYNG